MGDDPNTYDDESAANVNGNFLKDPKSGAPILGEGVDVKLDDLTGYSFNMNKVQTNFGHLSGATMATLEGQVSGAFAGKAPSLAWTSYMYQLATHNAGELSKFYQGITTGVFNVASAAQVVANVYEDADVTNAANLQAIEFAFGDLSKAPDGVPKQLLDKLKTYDQIMADRGGDPGAAPKDATTQEKSPDGNTITTVTKLPGDHEMKSVQTVSSPSPGVFVTTTTTYYDGKVQTVSTRTDSGGGNVATRTTQSYYDKDGKPTVDRVTSEGSTTVARGPDHTETTTSSTSYTYDEEGKELLDDTTTEQKVQVGDEQPDQPVVRPVDDPAVKKIQELQGH